MGSGDHAGAQHPQDQGGRIAARPASWPGRPGFSALALAPVVIVLAAVTLPLALPRVAHATVTCPVYLTGANPRLAAIDGRARLTWIDDHLTAAAHQARIWGWGWGLGIGASGVASLAVVPFVSRADRIDWYTSAASAAIGVVPFLVSPLDVAKDARTLHQRLVVAAGTQQTIPDADVCSLLTDAESRLVRDADNQRLQQSWWLHAGNVAFNTGVTLFLGFGFHHWESGLINGIAGAAVGEAIILTQPTRTIDDLETYRSGARVYR